MVFSILDIDMGIMVLVLKMELDTKIVWAISLFAIYLLASPEVIIQDELDPINNSLHVKGYSYLQYINEKQGVCVETHDKKLHVGKVGNTKSMYPTLDGNSTVLLYTPVEVDDVHIGDIITYTPTWSDSESIIHRVIDISCDDRWYATAKGDNNDSPDDQKIRFDEINGVVWMVVY